MRNEYKITDPAEMLVDDSRFAFPHPGAMIRDAIEARGINVTEAAGRMDVPRDRLLAVLDGRASFDTSLAERLAVLFGPRFSELALRWQIAHDQQD